MTWKQTLSDWGYGILGFGALGVFCVTGTLCWTGDIWALLPGGETAPGQNASPSEAFMAPLVTPHGRNDVVTAIQWGGTIDLSGDGKLLLTRELDGIMTVTVHNTQLGTDAVTIADNVVMVSGVVHDGAGAFDLGAHKLKGALYKVEFEQDTTSTGKLMITTWSEPDFTMIKDAGDLKLVFTPTVVTKEPPDPAPAPAPK